MSLSSKPLWVPRPTRFEFELKVDYTLCDLFLQHHKALDLLDDRVTLPYAKCLTPEEIAAFVSQVE